MALNWLHAPRFRSNLKDGPPLHYEPHCPMLVSSRNSIPTTSPRPAPRAEVGGAHTARHALGEPMHALPGRLLFNQKVLAALVSSTIYSLPFRGVRRQGGPVPAGLGSRVASPRSADLSCRRRSRVGSPSRPPSAIFFSASSRLPSMITYVLLYLPYADGGPAPQFLRGPRCCMQEEIVPPSSIPLRLPCLASPPGATDPARHDCSPRAALAGISRGAFTRIRSPARARYCTQGRHRPPLHMPYTSYLPIPRTHAHSLLDMAS